MENQNYIMREITPLSDRDCFYIADRRKTEFTYPIHCHAEFELNFTEHAAGVRRVVGDSAEIIGDYDLVLITGKELEHVWEQHECDSKEIREITIQFSPDLFFKNFMNKNQFDSIRCMLEKAQCGISFPMQAIMKVYNWLDRLASEEQGFYAVINLLVILYELSQCEDTRTLSSSSFAKISVYSDSRRVQKVQDYIDQHYNEEIRLGQLADLVSMTSVSFSRFFKLRTGKNLSEYIIDIRLGHATRMLVDSTMSIAEICFECGFNNLSNFNRIFKKKKNCTPKEFRENYQKKKKLI
ncbi:AraC family transcriptional regulator [Bacteroides intestinalis]|jgi:AraC-like DNA-binding protein|uniref:AraC family transcriptional regulator n=1 Tax=Bacteroides intestinalis TaxID=329854 RepID=A0A3E4KX23_9BACE|nr:AraC family transcriptional regulator [Bacteroides intestinalis]QDO67760.1 helix-turn-helix transcriptional regulator [Bacteroides intestinalis]RGK25440.1 AraC family transcriptional regulator [Bacteroides intestinalis]RGT50617.1 AraC family transcriptional regulator [Bacteroides intestinalis]RGX83995.1 AraC family transcriptional regulator [Bacteroides intestinalis]UCB35990.1 helix-turn-helix domain-containing protein [Bacteroides intestinalis]